MRDYRMLFATSFYLAYYTRVDGDANYIEFNPNAGALLGVRTEDYENRIYDTDPFIKKTDYT